MEKLDKKQIFNNWSHHGTIEEINTFNKKLCSERVEIAYKAGLEYSENHYLETIRRYEESTQVFTKSLNQYESKLQQAKELLKEAKNIIQGLQFNSREELERIEVFNKIEEFLKQ